jgi:hypothetical protein
MLLEELGRPRQELDHVLLAGQRMALVLGDHVFDRYLALAQSAHDHVRLTARHPRIVRSGVDEERRDDLVHIVER